MSLIGVDSVMWHATPVNPSPPPPSSSPPCSYGVLNLGKLMPHCVECLYPKFGVVVE